MADRKADKRGLGRGLSALMADVTPNADASRPDAQRVPIEQIIPNPDQPRRDFSPEALNDLAELDPQPGRLAAVDRARPSRWGWAVPDRRRRAALARGADCATSRSAGHRAGILRRRDAGNRADREYPARRPERRGRGGVLSSADGKIRAHAGKACRGAEQKPQSHLEHPAASQPARAGAGDAARQSSVRGSCARADYRARSGRDCAPGCRTRLVGARHRATGARPAGPQDRHAAPPAAREGCRHARAWNRTCLRSSG